MRRFALLACLVGGGLLISCEDDSAYMAGPSTFQNDTLDGAAGAPANMDAGADMAGAAGTTGAAGAPPATGGTTGSGGTPATGGTSGSGGMPATGGASGK